MLLHGFLSAIIGKTKHRPVKLKNIQPICILVCILTIPEIAHAATFDYKAVFGAPCVDIMTLSTPVPELTEFTVCTYIKLASSNPWTAFTYQLPTSSINVYEFGVLGDSSSLKIWMFGTQINVFDKLNLHTWYEICIMWSGKNESMGFYLDGILIADRKLENKTKLVGGGSVVLGCSHFKEINASVSVGVVGEMYMFRMWNTTQTVLLQNCNDGDVIKWKKEDWIYSSNVVQQDSSLHCAKEQSAAVQSGQINNNIHMLHKRSLGGLARSWWTGAATANPSITAPLITPTSSITTGTEWKSTGAAQINSTEIKTLISGSNTFSAVQTTNISSGTTFTINSASNSTLWTSSSSSSSSSSLFSTDITNGNDTTSNFSTFSTSSIITNITNGDSSWSSSITSQHSYSTSDFNQTTSGSMNCVNDSNAFQNWYLDICNTTSGNGSAYEIVFVDSEDNCTQAEKKVNNYLQNNSYTNVTKMTCRTLVFGINDSVFICDLFKKSRTYIMKLNKIDYYCCHEECSSPACIASTPACGVQSTANNNVNLSTGEAPYFGTDTSANSAPSTTSTKGSSGTFSGQPITTDNIVSDVNVKPSIAITSEVTANSKFSTSTNTSTTIGSIGAVATVTSESGATGDQRTITTINSKTNETGNSGSTWPSNSGSNSTTNSGTTRTTNSESDLTTNSGFTWPSNSGSNSTNNSGTTRSTNSESDSTTNSGSTGTSSSGSNSTTNSASTGTTNSKSNSTTNSGTTRTSNSGSNSTTNSGTTRTSSSGSNSTANSGTTRTSNSGSNSTANSGTTRTTNSESNSTTNSGSTGTTNSESNSTTNSGSTGTTNSEFNSTTNSGSTGTSNSGSNSTTNSESTGTTNSKSNSTTNSGTTRTTNSKSDSTSNSRSTGTASSGSNSTTNSASTTITIGFTSSDNTTIPVNITDGLKGWIAILSSPDLNSSTVNLMVSKLEEMLSGEVNPGDSEAMLNVLNSFLNVSLSLLGPVSNRLIKIVDKIGLKLTFPGPSINITSQSLALAVTKVNDSSFTGTSFGVNSSSGLQVSLGSQASADSDGSILLPASLINNLSPNDKRNASRLQFNYYAKTSFFQDRSLTNQELVSTVISSSVANLSLTNLSENVTVTLKITPKNHSQTVDCVFWDFNKNNQTGGWSSYGCSVVNTTRNETVCRCNHLTSFAILMNVSPNDPINPYDELVLTFVTYIGCGLSAIFLSVTLVTYIAFEKIRRDYPSKILIQLCAALVCLNLTFLLNPWIALYKKIPGLCISVAAFLHYFILVSITWMGLEAFHMYLSLVKVFNTYVRKYILKFCIIAWGAPAVVVAIILAVHRDVYYCKTSEKYPNGSTDDFCWMNDTVFWITIVGYYAIIFLLNVSMFVVVLIQLCRIKSQKQLGYQRKTTFQDIRSVAGITFLLGITWGLGFFSFGPGKTVIMYLFTIFNCLQGFFIFFFYCVAKENVRKQWRRYLCCGKFKLAENSDWSKTATNKLRKQTSKQGVSSSSSNSIQSTSNTNSTTLLVSNEYSLHPNGNGNVHKERNGVSFILQNGEMPLQELAGRPSNKNGDVKQNSMRRTSNRGSVHFVDQI